MKIVVVGYGRMGHEIEQAARERNHEVVATVDPAAPDAFATSIDELERKGVSPDEPTVAIDFSLPDGLAENVAAYARLGWAAVIGTTGWAADREPVLAPARSAGIPLVYGANFSVGANLFFRIARYAGRLAAHAGLYDGAVVELHHRLKQDSPSGTALTIAESLLRELPRKDHLQTETLHRRIESDELHVVSGRVGSIPGTHTVYLDSNADTIELTHRARNRSGFAAGAVQAAEWIVNQKGIFEVDQFFDDLFQD